MDQHGERNESTDTKVMVPMDSAYDRKHPL